jgi:hypothetical protein
MLNYEPTDRPHALAWETETLPNPDLLLKLIAASRQKTLRQAPRPAQPAKAAFQPEHLAGLCASA